MIEQHKEHTLVVNMSTSDYEREMLNARKKLLSGVIELFKDKTKQPLKCEAVKELIEYNIIQEYQAVKE